MTQSAMQQIVSNVMFGTWHERLQELKAWRRRSWWWSWAFPSFTRENDRQICLIRKKMGYGN